MLFTKETEAQTQGYSIAIKIVNESSIYIRITYHWPFYKLTQNIIHTFKFYYTEVDNLEDLTT